MNLKVPFQDKTNPNFKKYQR